MDQQRADKQLQILTNSPLIGFIETDLQGNILDANSTFASILGYNGRQECLGKNILDKYKDPDDRSRLLSLLRTTGSVERHEAEFIDNNGNTIVVLLNATLENDLIYTVFIDITDKKQNEDLIKETTEQYRSLFENANFGIAVHDIIYDEEGVAIDYQVTDVNPAYSTILGYKKENVVGKMASQIYGTAHVPYLDVYEEVAQSGNSKIFETYFAPLDTHFRILTYPVKPGTFVIVFGDITTMKKTEIGLRESEKQFKILVEKANQGVFVYDEHGQFHLVNNTACKTLGYTEEELLKITATKIDPDFTPGKENKIAGHEFPLILERKHHKKDGSEISVEVYLSKIPFNGKTMILALVSDITERKMAEQERERLIGELQEALEKVKTLSGLLPICASCKKIRDDKGYWNQIETYISLHSEANFSHGICPDCMESLYGHEEWYQKGKMKKR